MEDYINFKGNLEKLSKKDLELLFIKLQNYKIAYADTLNVDKKISIGVELEFENASLEGVKQEFDKDPQFQYWQVITDESCTSYTNNLTIGGEVTSPVLHDLKPDWQTLSNATQILKNLKAKSTNNTSLHIHLGNQIFGLNIQNVIRFVKVWCIFEHVIFKFAYGADKTYRPKILYFAHSIADATKLKCKHIPGFFEYLTIPRALGFNKKWAINFANFYDLIATEESNEAIEIRIANGTLEKNTIQNTINLYIKLINYVCSDRYDEKLIDRLFKRLIPKSIIEYDDIYINDAIKFADLIFENNLDKINFLKQYVKEDETVFIR